MSKKIPDIVSSPEQIRFNIAIKRINNAELEYEKALVAYEIQAYKDQLVEKIEELDGKDSVVCKEDVISIIRESKE